jgi:hypothetical protein
LLSVRDAACVSIYLPTAPEERGERDRLDSRTWEHVLDDLAEDGAFWARQAHSLAVFATPLGARTFQVANRLSPMVEVSDRFHVKPLLRSATFPQAAFVLALSQNAVRLVEVSADAPPAEVSVPGMPSDAASAVGKASIADRSPDRRLQGSEGQKVRLRQYARRVEEALRPTLAGLDLPLILAGVADQVHVLEREIAVVLAHRAKRRISVEHDRSSGYPDWAAANTMQAMAISTAVSHTSRVIWTCRMRERWRPSAGVHDDGRRFLRRATNSRNDLHPCEASIAHGAPACRHR